jgi:hypothetical protein
MCAQHTTVLAAQSCHRCGLPMCELCAFPFNGQMLCPNCIGQAAPPPAPVAYATAQRAYGYAGTRYTPVSAVPAGVRCVQHPNVSATQQCKLCAAYMCGTCDFALPDGVHICPACAAKPKTDLSPRRKKLMITSYVMAAVSTLGMAIVFTGALRAIDDRAARTGLAVLLMFVTLICSTIGTAVGFSARDRRLPTPMALWIAAIWNSVMLACYLLTIILRVIGL